MRLKLTTRTTLRIVQATSWLLAMLVIPGAIGFMHHGRIGDSMLWSGLVGAAFVLGRHHAMAGLRLRDGDRLRRQPAAETPAAADEEANAIHIHVKADANGNIRSTAKGDLSGLPAELSGMAAGIAVARARQVSETVLDSLKSAGEPVLAAEFMYGVAVGLSAQPDSINGQCVVQMATTAAKDGEAA